MSRALYNIVIVYLLTELHSGYEFPWMLQDVVPLGLWAGKCSAQDPCVCMCVCACACACHI